MSMIGRSGVQAAPERQYRVEWLEVDRDGLWRTRHSAILSEEGGRRQFNALAVIAADSPKVADVQLLTRTVSTWTVIT